MPVEMSLATETASGLHPGTAWPQLGDVSSEETSYSTACVKEMKLRVSSVIETVNKSLAQHKAPPPKPKALQFRDGSRHWPAVSQGLLQKDAQRDLGNETQRSVCHFLGADGEHRGHQQAQQRAADGIGT